MRVTGIIGAAALASLLGIATPAYTQEGHRGDSRGHSAQKQYSNHGNQQQQRPSTRGQRRQEQQRVRHGAWQEHRANTWQSDHRTWRDRGGYHGYRVSDNHYRRYFGPNHGFRINTRPFRGSGGQLAFQYRGYWVNVVDPWPENWSNNWYDTDDVYVTYAEDGYYLHNRRHPGVGLSIQISL